MVNKKILILGEGFIGQALKDGLKCLSDGSRISSLSDAERLIKKYRPKIIINCIGVSGKDNVDDCELEKNKALFANSFIPVILAEAALRNNIKLIHISSGCIFDFNRKKDEPVKEDSQKYFYDLFYSRSKIYAERAIEFLSKKYDILILRIRIPLSDSKHPKNILDKLIKYKKVIALPNSLTYLPDFIRAVKHLIKIKARGTYNIVNDGALRYPLLMRLYQGLVPSFKYRVVDLKKLGLVRTNLIMSNRKLKKCGFKTRNINSVLEECLKSYLKS